MEATIESKTSINPSDFFPEFQEQLFILNSDLIVLFANKTAYEASNKQEKDIRGSKCADICRIKNINLKSCPCLKAISTGQSETAELFNKSLGRRFTVRAIPVYDKTHIIRKIIVLKSEILNYEKIYEKSDFYKSLYLSLFNLGTLTILQIDPVMGQILEANPAACKFYGYKHELLTRKTFADLCISMNHKEMYNLLNMGSGAQSYMSLQQRTAEGIQKDVLASFSTVKDKENSVLVVITDISEHFIREDKLFRTNLVLQAKMKKLSFISSMCDKFKLYTSDTDSLLADLKNSLWEYYKGSPVQGFEIKFEDSIIQEGGIGVSDWLDVMEVPVTLKNETAGSISVFYEKSANSLSPDFDANEEKQFLGLLAEKLKLCAEKKGMQEQIFQTKKWYELLAENSADMLVILDESLNEIFISPSSINLCGYSPEILHKISFFNIIVPEEKDAVKKAIMTFCQKQHETLELSYQIQHLDHSIHWVECQAKKTYDKSGKLKTFLINLRNIDQKRSYEQKLIEAKNKAEESDKLKTAFLSNISHEIRTPLNAISGFSQLLQLEGLSDHNKADYLPMINSATDDLMQTIDRIIEISQVSVGSVKMKNEIFDLNSLMDELISLGISKLARQNKSHIAFESKMDENVHKFNGDRKYLYRVLYHLIDNAVKFTHQGCITIGYTANENNKVEFFVKDTGIGIQPELQQIIFQKFVQGEEYLTRQYSGNGLGLAICKGLIEKMNGKLWLSSLPALGSTFSFTLPLIN
jgi:PAS domain S-box-containing protein